LLKQSREVVAIHDPHTFSDFDDRGIAPEKFLAGIADAQPVEEMDWRHGERFLKTAL
jgi:hypothetical protein